MLLLHLDDRLLDFAWTEGRTSFAIQYGLQHARYYAIVAKPIEDFPAHS